MTTTMINVKMMLLSHFIFLKGGEIKIQFTKLTKAKKFLHQIEDQIACY